MPPAPPPPPTYFYAFADAHRARRFVEKLADELFHLAIFIQDEQVIVLDGSPDDHAVPRRRRRIAQLAMESQGRMLAVRPLR